MGVVATEQEAAAVGAVGGGGAGVGGGVVAGGGGGVRVARGDCDIGLFGVVVADAAAASAESQELEEARRSAGHLGPTFCIGSDEGKKYHYAYGLCTLFRWNC